MYRNSTRIIISIFCLLFGGYSVYINKYTQSIILLLCAIASLLLLLIFGTVSRAAKHIKKADYEKARESLERIKDPHLLFKSQKGYYYLYWGLIYAYENELEKAEDSLRRAIHFGLKTDTDKDLLYFTLAQVLYRMGQTTEAASYYGEIKDLIQYPNYMTLESKNNDGDNV